MELIVAGLGKSYGDHEVLSAWSARLNPGCHAITGPNGSGKSTLLAILAGALPADAGYVSLSEVELDKQPQQYRGLLAWCPDHLDFFHFLSGRDFLDLSSALRPGGLQRTAIITRFGLEPFLNLPIKALSLGTRKKLLLASALICNPALLLLDEPSNELDSAAREALIENLNQRSGTIVLMATHDRHLITQLNANELPIRANATHA